MNRKTSSGLALLPALLLSLPAMAAAQTPAPSSAPAAAKPAPGNAPVLAVVDGVSVTDADLREHPQWGQLFTLESQLYNARKQLVDDVIARRLFEKEAAARGVSPEELARTEINAKSAPPTDAEVSAFYEENKSRITGMDEAQAKVRVRDYLSEQGQRSRRSDFVRELRAKSKVQVLIDAPRTTVSVDDDPARGPASAPITIVEFSDFQCPFCTRGEEVVKQVFARYGDKVRLVYRDLPLPNHEHAQKAAEAAHCAGDQGKYWDMHGSLFQNQGQLDPAGIERQAGTIGLDVAAFKTCLSSGKYAEEVRKDAADAAEAGVNSTPAFFINGRLISGARPLEDFVSVIDQELERAGVAIPAPPKPAAAATPAAAASPAPHKH